MNFEFAEQINPSLEQLDMSSAIAIAEARLRQLPPTEFHEVIGLSLVGQAHDLAIWVDQFYQAVSKRIEVEALYFELTEFDINTDQWYIDCFAYTKDGGLDANDMEWLVEFDASSQEEIGTVFLIEGYENLQKAFETFDEKPSDLEREDASSWCEQIIIARFMELMRAAHLSAKDSKLPWANLPIYFTEHAYDFIVRSEMTE